MTTTQACPNCGIQHDIRVYVSGQRVTCKCGIRFEVRRLDVQGTRSGMSGISPAARDGNTTFAPHRAQGGAEHTRDTVVPGGGGSQVRRVEVDVLLPGVAVGGGVGESVEGPTLGDVTDVVQEVGGGMFPGGAGPGQDRGVSVESGRTGSNGVALPGVPLSGAAPVDGSVGAPGASGVALPSATPSIEEAVGRTVVRTGLPTGRGDEASDLDVHAASTYVGPKVTLPGFELLELLGRGGMGEVWLGRQVSLGRTVAVKLLPPRLAKDPEFVARFEKEATALAALNHPHIVQIIDRGVVGEHYFFVMEFVEGRSLREAMGNSALTPQQALKWMLQAARAIECAHDKDIIHRDLKPENILLDGRGHVKVADFGLAGIRQADTAQHLTATAVAMGTLNYMAPEQRRDAKSVDGRADLFSLGVVLYEVLTGELPLGRFKLPSRKVPGLDPRVDTVVERLLETDPEARYANAGEFCQALEAMISSSSGPALMPSGTTERRPVTTRGNSQLTRKLRLGWRRVRGGLSLVGGLAVLGLAVRWFVGPVSLHVGPVDKGGQEAAQGPAKPWPPNTYHEVFASAELVAPEQPGGVSRFEVSFNTNGAEELNLHSGEWKLVDGQLQAKQGGKETQGRRLVPRAYVARRYFAADDFDAQVLMDVKHLGKEYAEEPDAQHYGELSFRIKDLQVSAFAIPDVGMRLAWRYFSDDGQEVVGNSAQDTDSLVEDEMPLPSDGPYTVRLKMSRAKGGVLVEGFLGRHRFARKLLPGLENRVGKVALGCRNLACSFDDLKVKGRLEERPARKVAAGQEQ
ncbi:serine/threonine protein kinase [Myxococcus sp. K15C18031901]|uniref:serine/threonine-protein kinase n=1 Tax=Myxococcus dinghuensis TaxID=2906761 RepID=UPI0020A6FF9A|nr:serine/threonine-protein kinase [Myxococcus dinghuensis]MCP3103632.1 serine/threonine protein kinase [Myxococcus dinghuensis]